MTHGYHNRFGEERFDNALAETGKVILDAVSKDWLFGTSSVVSSGSGWWDLRRRRREEESIIILA